MRHIPCSNKASAKRMITNSIDIDNLPEWINGGGNQFIACSDRVGFRGFPTMNRDSRTEMCTQADGLEAKGHIASMISTSRLSDSGISVDERDLVSSRLKAAISQQRIAKFETIEGTGIRLNSMMTRNISSTGMLVRCHSFF